MINNYEDIKCKNKGNSTKEEKWLQLLLNGNSSKEFDEIKSNSRSALFALCKYKKILRQRGRGCVSFTEFQRCYNTDMSNLHIALNELFLEYYTADEIDIFLNLMKETNTNILDVYNRHMDNPEDTLFSTLTL